MERTINQNGTRPLKSNTETKNNSFIILRENDFPVWTSEIIYGSSYKMSQKFYDPRNLSQESRICLLKQGSRPRKWKTCGPETGDPTWRGKKGIPRMMVKGSFWMAMGSKAR